MSWTDEELDALVREAANEKQVAYKDAYWHEMEAMLGASPARKISGWWWFNGIAFLAITIGATFVASSSGSPESNNNKLALSSELNEANLSNDLKNPMNVNSIVESIELNDDLKLNQNENIEIKAKSTKTKVINNEFKSTKLATLTNIAQAYKPSRSENVIEKSTSFNELNNGKRIVFESENNDFMGVKNDLSQNSDESSGVNSVGNSAFQNIAVSELMLKNWHSNPTSFFDRTPSNIPYLANKRVGFYAGLYGGLGHSYATTESKNALFQLGVSGGVEFFVRKWSFGVGLGYRQQFVRNLEIRSHKQYYTFGLMNVNQNLEYDQLLFADLNLNVNYSFGRSEIGIQASPTYMLGVRLNYSENREEIFGDKSIVTSVPEKNNQYVSSNNFETLSMNVGLNYSYAIQKNILLNLNLNTRVGGSLLKNSFAGNERKMPLMLEFGIKKRF